MEATRRLERRLVKTVATPIDHLGVCDAPVSIDVEPQHDLGFEPGASGLRGVGWIARHEQFRPLQPIQTCFVRARWRWLPPPIGLTRARRFGALDGLFGLGGPRRLARLCRLGELLRLDGLGRLGISQTAAGNES
jgi:hypothetical protein